MVEVTVIGRGPAGLALSAALAESGVQTTLVGPAPRPERPFPNNYGIWTDELEALGLTEVAGLRFPWTEVRLDEARVHRLARGYARVDDRRLHQVLCSRFLAAGGRTIDAEVRQVQGGPTESELELSSGEKWHSRLVVDATGSEARFLRPRPPATRSAQVAYGVLAEVEAHPFDLDTMRLMDFSPILGAPDAPTSFLYLMPIAKDRLFVEETSLSARPPVPIEMMQERLQLRLRMLGVELRRVLETERCFIPMGAPLPNPDQPIVGFGAAGGLVHPATGYSLARSLFAAPAVAAAIRSALDRGEALPPAAWRALWPREARRAEALFRLGLEVLLDLDAANTRHFFHAFFQTPQEEWRPYLAGRASPAQVLQTMHAVFARLSGTGKARVIHSIFQRKSLSALSSALVPGSSI